MYRKRNGFDRNSGNFKGHLRGEALELFIAAARCQLKQNVPLTIAISGKWNNDFFRILPRRASIAAHIYS